MRAILPAVCCICFLLRTAGAQWLETTIWLPDSLGGIEHPWAVYYVPPSNCVYVCGEEGVLVVDCATIARVARFDLSEPSLLAFDSRDNKVYLHYYGQGESLAVIDPVAHRVVSRVRAGRYIEALCYNPVANKLYCLGGSNTDTITVVDCEGDSVLSRVYVGECRGETGQLCCNTLGNKVYCAAYYADSVAVIDGAGDSLLTFVPLGESPRRVVYCPAGNKVYCSVHNSDQVAVIDAGPDTVLRRIQVSEGPATLGYNPVSNKAYVAPWHSDGVDIIDCSADTLLRWVGPGGEDYMVAFVLDSADNRVFCLNGYYEYIPAICGWGDTLVGQVELEGGHESPDAVCYSPVENCLYIIGEEITDLVVADAATCRVVGRVQLMCEPYLPCYTSARDKLYVLDYASGVIAVVDCASNRLLSQVPTPASYLRSPVYDPHLDKLYCAGDQGTDAVLLVFDCARDTVAATLPMERSATALAYNPAAGKVYWANHDDDPATVTVVDCRTDSIVAEVPVGAYPSGLTCDPDSNRVYCAWYRNDTLFVSAIDGAGDSVTGTVAARADEYAPSPRLCYVPTADVVCATTDDSVIVVVDGAARQVLGPLALGGQPAELLFNGVDDKLYCLLPNSDDVAVVDCRYMSPQGRVRVADGPRAMAFDSIANRLYVISPYVGCVSVIDGRTSRFLGLVEAGGHPTSPAWAPQHRRMYICDAHGGAVVVLRDSAVAGLAGEPAARGPASSATVVRGVLFLPSGAGHGAAPPGESEPCPRPVLIDAMGRKVLALLPGPNDVRHLPPGVYFVRRDGAAARGAGGMTTKVVLAR